MVLALLLAVHPALAAGFHFFKVEVVGTTTSEGDLGVGVGGSAFSDLFHAWMALGDPAADGRVVRAGWVESRWMGPVLGVVPPAFRDMVPDRSEGRVVRWTSFRAGGDANQRLSFQLDLAQHLLLNVPGFAGVEPRRGFLGPELGLGLNGSWWRDWKDQPDVPVMTGKLTGQGGIAGGVTVRDTWYAQGRATGRVDVFGVHQAELVVLATTGLFLERVGVPFGLEVSGELSTGNDNVHATGEMRWAALGSLYWKLTPPYETRIEERIEAEGDLRPR